MTPRREMPLGDAFGQTIDRLRSIAAEAGDAIVTEGPVHPDRVLLELCGEALFRLKAAEFVYERRIIGTKRPDHPYTDEDRQSDTEDMVRYQTLNAQASAMLRAARKHAAATPAGIYAKALCVRASATGAKDLAMSLAEDLIACEGLRATLWPARDREDPA